MLSLSQHRVCGVHYARSQALCCGLRFVANGVFDGVEKMRSARISALAALPADKTELVRVAEPFVHDFLFFASSKQHRFKLNAMDAIGLIKLCRKSGQPSRIAQIWPHIQKLSMLPAKDERTTSTLIGSVISCVLEAKDPSTAASVCTYLSTAPHIPLAESAATRMLSSLRGQPKHVVEFLSSVQRGAHGVRVDAQHFSVAMQAVADSPDHCDQVFELARSCKMVGAVMLIVWCQALQQHKDLNRALDTLLIADSLGITPEPSHYTVLLSCAADMKSLKATQRIHEHLNSHPTAKTDNIMFGALLQSYSQCGDFKSAAAVFERAVKQKQVDAVTLVVWCQALQQHKDLNRALDTLSIADSLGITPKPSHYTVLLSCATEIKSLEATKRIHKHLKNHPTAQRDDVVLGALVKSFSQCGDFETAAGIFEQALKQKQVGAVTLVVWCQALQEHKDLNGALDTLSIADSLGIAPEASHYTVLLSCAAEMKSLTATKHIHEHLNNHPTAKRIGIVLGALLQSYSQCGDFETAAEIFEQALQQEKVDAVMLIVWCQALQQHKDLNGALNTLSIADSLGITPEPSHYTVLLSCAAEMKSLTATQRIHEHLNSHPTAKSTGIVLGALLQSYSQCGDFKSAAAVFNHALKQKQVHAVTLVVWCQALQQHKDLDAALNTLSIADSLGITPTPSHYTVLLSCAAEIKSLEATKRIHNHLNSHPTAKASIVTNGALVHTYAQCGELKTAVGVFESGLKNGLVFDVAGWNSLASAFVAQGMMQEAQATLERMTTAADIKPNGVTLVVWCQIFQQHKDFAGALHTLSTADSLSITPEPAHYTLLLSCAAEMNSLEATKRIHDHLKLNNPAAAFNVSTISALIHSYAQCGDLKTAVDLFEDGLRRGLVFDVKGWNCAVNAFAGHGMVKEAQATLERMMAAGVKPDAITATCLLNAASHSGLGLGVRQLFDKLQSHFPDIQFDEMLRTCVVDGLARAGLFDEAVAEARKLESDVPWTAVLGAARSHNRLDIGEMAFNEIKRLCSDNGNLAAAHVLMAHIYTANGRDEEAAQMREHMKNDGLRKLPGESSIEVDGVMHTFRVGDTSHPETKQIVELNDKLHEQLKADGYVPEVVWASRGAGVSAQTKAQALCEHSERFALVYGLLHSDDGQPLTIFNNLRVRGLSQRNQACIQSFESQVDSQGHEQVARF